MSNVCQYMNSALAEAKLAKLEDEVPVGAVVVMQNKIIGRGHNTVIKDHSISSHAEINAIADAGKFLKNYRLNHCELYVTLEPCHMCAKAIVDARIKKVFLLLKNQKLALLYQETHFLKKVTLIIMFSLNMD